MLVPLKLGTAQGEGMAERGGGGGACPPPAFFVQNKRKKVFQKFLVTFMVEKKEDITVAGKLQ